MNWNADLYTQKHAFVFHYGTGLIDLLAPQPGERIIDVGCGTGELTRQLADRGASVVGIDAAEPMIAKARMQFPDLDLRVADITTVELPERFDAIFSNAVLHWVTDYDPAIRQMKKHLKPGGRLVAEFGGQNNVKQITDEVLRQLQKRGYTQDIDWWYFPSVGEYASALERHGFRVQLAQHYDRDTLLDDPNSGLMDWLDQFGLYFFRDVLPADKTAVLEATQAALRPVLFRDGRWYADYKRLRVVATV